MHESRRLGRRRAGLLTAAAGLFAPPLLMLSACGTAGRRAPAARDVPGETGSGWTCVPYARQRSGIDLAGDAWQWWEAAEGRYRRGHTPREGSVLVLLRTSRLRQGHVAVVSRLVSRREIRVDHANWGSGGGKGRVARDQPVRDASADNDWSLVEIWYPPIRDFGRSRWPAYGFIHV
jgi:CHAP domain